MLETRLINIFISYSRNDEFFRENILKEFSVLKNLFNLEVWHDRLINAGDEWSRELTESLNNADIYLFLLSPDALDSKFIIHKELKIAYERYRKKERVVIVPIILKHCGWKDTAFKSFQALPPDGYPIESKSKWDSTSEAYHFIREGLKQCINDFLNPQFLTRAERKDVIKIEKTIFEMRQHDSFSYLDDSNQDKNNNDGLDFLSKESYSLSELGYKLHSLSIYDLNYFEKVINIIKSTFHKIENIKNLFENAGIESEEILLNFKEIERDYEKIRNYLAQGKSDVEEIRVLFVYPCLKHIRTSTKSISHRIIDIYGFSPN